MTHALSKGWPGYGNVQHYTDFNHLVGQTVVELHTDPERVYLCFTLADGRRVVFVAEGDCCNDVWFNHITGVEALIGRTVLSTENKEWVDVEATRQECEEAGFFTLCTERGRCDIEVRNSHNGYYGGSISYLGENGLTEPVAITEDF
jgi:hypothetical protein